MKKELKNKLVKWTENNTDYMVNETYSFSDLNPNEKVLQVYKKRVNPIKPKPIKGKYVNVRGCISDTHHIVLEVYPKRKYYNIKDYRVFSEYSDGGWYGGFKSGLTFDELIETITDETCGVDWREMVKVVGGLSGEQDNDGKWYYKMDNGETLTDKVLKEIVL
jgi:hypothetical protein